MSRLVCSEGGKILKNGMVVVEMMSWVVSNDNIFFFYPLVIFVRSRIMRFGGSGVN